MNCKPGDLAVLIKSRVGNQGAIVEVLKPLGCTPKFDDHLWCEGEFCWLVRSVGAPLKALHGMAYQECPAPDAYLRPIRDNDADDETLTWAGKPEAVTA